MLLIKVFCDEKVTEIHARNIFDLVKRTTAAKGLPHGSHMLILRGKHAKKAIKQFAKVNVNWTTESKPTKYGVHIGLPLRTSDRMQILSCPNSLI